MVSQVSGSCNLLVRIVYQHLCFNSFSSHREWCLVGALSSEGVCRPGWETEVGRPWPAPRLPVLAGALLVFGVMQSLREEPPVFSLLPAEMPRLWFVMEPWVWWMQMQVMCGLSVPLHLLPGGLGSPAHLITSPKAS